MSESKYQLITGVEDKPRKVVIYGTPCIGKSSFAEQFPDPIFIQTENAGGMIKADRLPIVKSIGEFYEQLTAVAKGELGDHKTLVVDSLKSLEQLIVKDVCAKRGINCLDDVDYGKAYGEAMGGWHKLLDWLDRLVENGVHVVLLAHIAPRIVKDPRMDEYESTSLDLMVWGKTYNPTNNIVCWADCVFYLAHELFTKSEGTGIGGKRTTAMSSGNRIIYTEERPAYLAKNRFDMPAELPFNKGEGYKVIEQYLTVQKD